MPSVVICCNFIVVVIFEFRNWSLLSPFNNLFGFLVEVLLAVRVALNKFLNLDGIMSPILAVNKIF